MKVSCACDTDKGNYRKVNQDAVFVNAICQKKHVLAVGAVFDGIGGLDRGEIASRVMELELQQWFSRICSWIDLTSLDKGVIFSHFRDLTEDLNEKIWELRDERQVNTGSTMSAILIFDNQYDIINVGDSRVYKFNQGLQCLTVDETVAREEGDGIRSYLANYIGKQRDLEFSEYQGVVEPNDLFFACSDGFYHNLTEMDMQLSLIHI